MAFNVSLTRNPNRSNALLGKYPLGNAPAINEMLPALFDYDALTTAQTLTLHPTGAAATGSQIRINFAIPFPRGALDDVANLVITDNADTELTTHVEEIAPWRDLSDNSTNGVRSARVWMNYTFADTSTVTLKFKTGTRTLELGAQSTYKNDWATIASQPANEYNDEYTSATFYEPKVYATCAADYLCSCNLIPRMEPLAGTFSDGASTYNATDISTPEYGFDEALLGFAHSVVNDVPAHVTTTSDTGQVKINYEVDYEPWLYDRPAFLYMCYIRTGDIKWLRHAVRASQFYAAHIPASGYFDLRADDIKYSYSLGPLLCALLAGDTDQSTTMERVTAPGRAGAFPYVHTGAQGWTERNMAYLIEQELCRWEYDGDTTAYNNVKTYLQSGIDQVASPYDSSAPNGTIKHDIMSHEGGPGNGDGTENVISPWMCNLLFSSYFRAYVLSETIDYLEFIAGYASEFESAFYTATFNSETVRVAWYLYGEQEFTDSGVGGDIQHACDVLNAVQLILWSQKQAGQTVSATLASYAEDLKNSAAVDQAYWYRNSQATIDAGYTIWRCTPPRRPLWQHGKSAHKWLESSREAV